MRAPYSRNRGTLSTMPGGTYYRTAQDDFYNASSTMSTSPINVSWGRDFVGEQMQDIVTPGFAFASAQGSLIVNPMSRYEGHYNDLPFSGDVSDATHIGPMPPSTGNVIHERISYSGYIPSIQSPAFIIPNLPSVEGLVKQAQNEALANARQRNMMGIVDLLEGGKTLDMLKTQFGRFEKLRDGSLFKGKKKRTASNKKTGTKVYEYQSKTAHGVAADAAGLHLELQYGIIPLMLSINGLVEALAKANSAAPARQTFRGHDSNSGYEEYVNTVNTNVANYVSGASTIRTDYKVRVDFDYIGRAGLISSYKPGLQGRLGLELGDLLSAGYELIPYSFVLDWLLDIGTFLEALSPAGKPSESLASWHGSQIKEITTFTEHRYPCTYVQGDANHRWSIQLFEYEASRIHVKTVKSRVPGISAQIPSLNTQFKSWIHLVSGAALILTNVSKRSASRIK